MQRSAPEKAPPNSWAARLAGPSSSGGTLTPGPQGASSSRAADPLTTASSGLSGSGQVGPAAHQTSGKVGGGQLLLLAVSHLGTCCRWLCPAQLLASHPHDRQVSSCCSFTGTPAVHCGQWP